MNPKPTMARWLLAAALTATASLCLAEPFGYSVNSRGDFADDQMVNALWRVNLQTGESEYIGWTSFLDLEGLALNADGHLFGADDESNTLVRVMTGSGLGVAIGGIRTNMGIPLGQIMDFGMAFQCDGSLHVVSDFRESLYLADPLSGHLQLVGSDGSLGVPITDIASWGGTTYGIGQGLNSDGQPDAPNLYRIDLEQATTELIGPLGPEASPYNNAGLSFDAEGQLWAITDRRAVGGQDHPSEILRIDTESGTAERIAESSIVGQESLAIAPPGGCVPEGEEPEPGDDPFTIPTLNGLGLPLLLLLIVVAAGWRLMRRGA